MSYTDKPKHQEEFYVCNCSNDKVKPAKGEILYKVEGGGTVKTKRYWCMTCGLNLRLAYMDQLNTEQWQDTRKNQPVFIEDKEEDEPFDPLI